MRVCFLVPDLNRAGAQSHTVSLAGGLVGAGHEVAIATFMPADSLADQVAAAGIERLHVPRSGVSDFGFVRRLTQAVASWRPHALVGVLEWGHVYAEAVRRRLPYHASTVAIVHMSGQAVFRDRLRLRLAGPALRRSDLAVFLSSRQRELFEAGYGPVGLRVEIVPNGVVIPPARPPRGPGLTRPLIAMVARMRPEKRHDIALRALSTLRDMGVDFEAELAGGGSGTPAAQALAEELSLRDRVIFRGDIDTVGELYSRADIGLLTSDMEAMPMALLECAASGIPVVSTDVGGCADVVEHGVTGLLAPPGDFAAIADALTDLCTHSDRRHEMGAAARDRAEREFSVDSMVARYDRLLTDLGALRSGTAG